MCGRWYLSIETTVVDATHTTGPYSVINKTTGASMEVYGFNHWAWVGKQMCVWASKDYATYSESMLDEWNAKFPPGSTLEVTGSIPVVPVCAYGLVSPSKTKFVGRANNYPEDNCCVCNNVGTITDGSDSAVRAQVQLLARQLLLIQTHGEQTVRSNGGSGFEQVRQFRGGSRAFHHASISNGGVANVRSHANNKYTIGMGEWARVLNGVHFGSRHNDYALVSPSKKDHIYNKNVQIQPPPVPPAVLTKATVAEQTEEMRQWFKAWADQDFSVRDYRLSSLLQARSFVCRGQLDQ
jgi:hypothetical protein